MDLLRIEEAAALLRLSPCTLRRLIVKKAIDYHKLGKMYFFTSEDIETYVASCQVKAVERHD